MLQGWQTFKHHWKPRSFDATVTTPLSSLKRSTMSSSYDKYNLHSINESRTLLLTWYHPFYLKITHRTQKMLTWFTRLSQSLQHSSSCSVREHDCPMCTWGTSKSWLWQKQKKKKSLSVKHKYTDMILGVITLILFYVMIRSSQHNRQRMFIWNLTGKFFGSFSVDIYKFVYRRINVKPHYVYI